jgi:MFS transporter, Spinster family, sphingosine-1-phosphate transporter
MPATELTRSGGISSGRSGFALAILSLINFFNYLDRYILAGVIPLLEKDLGIDHAEAGLLGSVFMVVYMIASPFGGYLGDRMPRRLLVAGGVFVWSLATIGSGLASTFALLLIARAIIGIGEAGYGTVAPALISDLFPKDLRTRMLSFFYLALPVGAAAGFAIGGWVGATYSWHSAFFIGGAPGLALAGLALLLPEPARGATDESSAAQKVPFRVGLHQLWRNATFWIVTVGLTLMTFAIGGLANWMPTFLNLERGMALGTAGPAFGAITAVAGFLGTLVGGLLGDWADRRRAHGGIWISGLSLALAAPLMIAIANVREASAIFTLTFVALFLIFINTGPLNAAIVNAVAPTFRAFAMGLSVLILHLFGDALSPTAIGAVGQRFSLATAIALNALPVLIAGLVLLIGTKFLRSPASSPLAA